MNEVIIIIPVYPVDADIDLKTAPPCRIAFQVSQLRHIYMSTDGIANIYIGDALAGGGHFSYRTRAEEVDELLEELALRT